VAKLNGLARAEQAQGRLGVADENRASSEDDKKSYVGLISAGSELVGGAAGGALGFLAAGPGGAAAAAVGGVALAKTLQALGNEVAARFLSPRERTRVGAALATAASETDERLSRGDTLRQDGFLDDGSDRPPAQEVMEGALQAAQRAWQEKKVPYLGRLAASLNFAPEFDLRAARWLIHLGDRLSYTQLCLLKLAFLREAGATLSPPLNQLGAR
jgi:hypothetical protein